MSHRRKLQLHVSIDAALNGKQRWSFLQHRCLSPRWKERFWVVCKWFHSLQHWCSKFHDYTQNQILENHGVAMFIILGMLSLRVWDIFATVLTQVPVGLHQIRNVFAICSVASLVFGVLMKTSLGKLHKGFYAIYEQRRIKISENQQLYFTFQIHTEPKPVERTPISQIQNKYKRRTLQSDLQEPNKSQKTQKQTLEQLTSMFSFVA